MRTKLCIILVGNLLATSGIEIARADAEFVLIPDLTNNSTYSFGCAWGERRAEI